MAPTKFLLRFRLRVIYLFYGGITTLGFYAIGRSMVQEEIGGYLPWVGSLPANTGEITALVVSSLLCLELLGQVESGLEFFNYNLQGKKKVNRVGYEFRDLFRMNDSPEVQWQSMLRVCFYRDVIPTVLGWLGLLLGGLTLLTKGLGIICFFYLDPCWRCGCPYEIDYAAIFLGVSYWLGFSTLGGLAMSFACDHLCNEEIGDLYKEPQSYFHPIAVAKSEVKERQAYESSQQRMARERQRNQPQPPPGDEDVFDPPDTPY